MGEIAMASKRLLSWEMHFVKTARASNDGRIHLAGRPKLLNREALADETNGITSSNSRLSPLTKEKSSGLPWPVTIFLIGMVTPWIIPVGPLNLSVYRFVLLITLFPCLFMWVRGKAGSIRYADVAIILFSAWASLSLAVVHGIELTVEKIGILNIETIGSYMLARCCIRTADDFRGVVQLASKLVVILLPFALYEWITGAKPLLNIFGLVFPTPEITMMEPRWGFWRVQGPFGHSILFGLFCGSLVGLAYLVLGYGKGTLSRCVLPVLIAVTAFLSMSSAPIAGMVLQAALIGWNTILRSFKYRWKVLWAFALVGYLVVEFGSNQTPVQFYISRFTFDAQTGWYRLLIWEFGSASVANHPFFGIGSGDWARPSWMGPSVDNFWLVIAMCQGVPALLLICTAWVAIVFGAAFKEGLDDRTDAYRNGYVFCIIMFLFVGCTVHFWHATYAWFLFMLGSGVWILDVKPVEQSSSEASHRHTTEVKVRAVFDGTSREERQGGRKRG